MPAAPDGHSLISPDVLARYAADAAADVRGAHTRGARVSGSEVSVHLGVDAGARIPAVAREVQRRVAEYLAQMADMRPSAVHVVVDDVERR